MTRSEWLKAEIKNIQAGIVVQMRCVMSTPERVEQGLCLGVLPQHRINRRQDTCSPECQEDKRRLKREIGALRICRHCGRGLTRTERTKLQEQAKNHQTHRGPTRIKPSPIKPPTSTSSALPLNSTVSDPAAIERRKNLAAQLKGTHGPRINHPADSTPNPEA
jgi:hypothetical protein